MISSQELTYLMNAIAYNYTFALTGRYNKGLVSTIPNRDILKTDD